DKILPVLFERKWSLLRTNDKAAKFVTSDRPFCLMWSQPLSNDLKQPIGIGLTGTTILFPVSSQLMLMGAFEGTPIEREVSAHQVANINGIIISFSKSQVYSCDGDFPYIRKRDKKVQRGAELVNDHQFLRHGAP